MRTFSYATGVIERLNKTWDEVIDFIKRLELNGIELTIATKESLNKFKLSEGNISFLKGLDYLSIHFPFYEIDAKNTSEMTSCLNMIEKIYKEFDAKNLIFHPNVLPDSELLKKYDFQVSLENLRAVRNITIEYLKEIFRQYPEMGFCLDVAHAFSFSKEETSNLVRNFKDKITEIHFSGAKGEESHLSLREVTPDFWESVEVIKTLDVPVVIEKWVDTNNLEFFKEEVKFIKRFFEE